MKKYFSLLIKVLMISAIICGCSQNTDQPSNGSNDEPVVFRMLYDVENTTLNYLASGKELEHAVACNMVDGLVEFDNHSNIVPAMAESWTTSDDGLVWTFKIRQGQKWYDNTGKEIADVTANDWVSGLKLVCDPKTDSGTYDQVKVIKGAEAYFNALAAGNEANFDDVGVKAIDTYTLEYTLERPTPYFLGGLAYACWLPVYGPLMDSLVTETGNDFGTSIDKIYSCGAFILTEWEPQVKQTFVKNTNNWDADRVYLDRIEKTYNAEAATLAPTTVAASAPLNPDVSLHSPKRPEEETDHSEPVAPRFRAASSEAQLDIEPDADDLPGAQDHMAAWDPVPQPKTTGPEPAAAEPAEIEETSAPAGTPEQMGFDLQEGPEPLRYVGELFRTYILAERGDEVCIIDKHAAHERQLFEKLAASYGDVPSQLLLEPVVVELSAEEKTALLANIDLLERAGLEIDDFGGNSVFLRAVPADVEQSSAEDLLVELAAKLAHGSRDALSEKTEWVLHSISCRAAIKAGDHTSPQELMALAEKILSGEVPPFCPHGRPCVLKLTRKELEKQFGRIV